MKRTALWLGALVVAILGLMQPAKAFFIIDPDPVPAIVYEQTWGGEVVNGGIALGEQGSVSESGGSFAVLNLSETESVKGFAVGMSSWSSLSTDREEWGSYLATQSEWSSTAQTLPLLGDVTCTAFFGSAAVDYIDTDYVFIYADDAGDLGTNWIGPGEYTGFQFHYSWGGGASPVVVAWDPTGTTLGETNHGEPPAIPEPATMLMLGVGLFGLAARRRGRKRAA